MRKRTWIGLGLALTGIGLVVGGSHMIAEHRPANVAPDPSWEPMLSQLDIRRMRLPVQCGDVTLEAELLIPNGGRAKKSAVVFSPGSGDSLYQNYACGLIKESVLDVFLPRDMAVLLINKRGMGDSEGSWMSNTFPGRSNDLYAGVQALQQHPDNDAQRIGLIGHSQGGWIVNLTAARHPDIAFFISLAGPVTSVRDQIIHTHQNRLRCEGHSNEEIAIQTARQLALVDLSATIGRWTGFGMFQFDAAMIGYDPCDVVQSVQCPGLFVFAEHDRLVPPEENLERFAALFPDGKPDHLSTTVIPRATHSFREASSLCSFLSEPPGPISTELATSLTSWLTEQDY